jgi:uncharacterized OB-fold protein
MEPEMGKEKRRIPVKEGLWCEPEDPRGRPRLVGSRCRKCGEVFFPKRDGSLCSYCQGEDFEEIKLSLRGTVYSYTVIMQRPPEYYKGEVPYAIGFVELPEGVRVETLFTGCELDDLQVGMEVEMVIDKLCEEEDGTEVYCYKFRPVKASNTGMEGGK